jgi:tetratricopeptide (TPR) repeat protein
VKGASASHQDEPSGRRARAQADAGAQQTSFDARHAALIFAGFALTALWVFQPSFSGPPISDDFLYVVDNPYIHPLTAGRVAELFDPFGLAKEHFGNYSPIHVLAHGLQRAVFGYQFAAYHVTNVLVHAVAGLLLVLVLVRSGASRCVAVFAGAFFLLHPAHVEAVAWFSQLKSTGAMALALAALLSLDRRPFLSSVLFAAALLTKAHAAFVLPLAAVRLWTLGDDAARRAWLGVAAWAVLFALYAPIQWEAFKAVGTTPRWDPLTPPDDIRMVFAAIAQYAVMATTGIGLSTLHELHPVDSWSDPWFLGGLAIAAALVARGVWALRARREEAAWWLGAAAAFVPVSQAVHFPFPIADRYVYFLMPGLLGGAALWIAARRAAAPTTRPAPRFELAVALASALLLVTFGFRSHTRATIWTNPEHRFADAAKSDPDGGAAYYLAARAAARRGDSAEAITLMERVARLNLDRVRSLTADPHFVGLHADPRFRTLLQEISQRYVDHAAANGYDSERWLLVIGEHYAVLGRTDDAIATLERGARRNGPLQRGLLEALARVRKMHTDSTRVTTREE